MNKKKSCWIVLVCAILMVVAAHSAYAKGVYVRDWITITVRTRPSEEAKIIAMANSNDYLEVIQEQPPNWTKVRTSSGREGWALTRYLTEETPKALIVDQLSEKVKTQAENILAFSDENKQLQKENREFRYKISNITKGLEKSKNEYEDLKKASSAYLELKASYDKLVEADKEHQDQMNVLSKENSRLKTSERIKFTLIGGGFVILGLILGVFLHALSARPKKSGYKL
ncbi:MAG: TIGR04211 family SH3 domain-containing protein [Deltaproteobacteria bacterium]|nr:TIGR04211 family SH3 domain-containing protein [Deltaproteobacteria bacterium]